MNASRTVPMRKTKGDNQQRLCIGCGTFFRKPFLIRIAVFKDGRALIDQMQRLGGRGLYLCPLWDCIATAHRRWRTKPLAKGLLTGGLSRDLLRHLMTYAFLASGDARGRDPQRSGRTVRGVRLFG